MNQLSVGSLMAIRTPVCLWPPFWKFKRRKKTADEEFYSDSAVKFDRFKVALRNPSMHVDKSYTEERAREIFDATKALMQHLALRISE